MNGGRWSKTRVLVTGHTGFKGGWLTLLLTSLGADVCGYALKPTSVRSLFNEARISSVCRSEFGDIRDRSKFDAVVRDFKPEVVFHLAAQAIVRASYRDPIETYSTNVMGLITVLEVLRRASSVRQVVNITSDKCYENREWAWGYRETDPMGGFDPYSSSKGCAELVTASWRRSFLTPGGINLASARAGNVIGGGDWAEDRLLPDFIRSIDAGRELLVRSPRATRPWQHVLEPLSGYILLAEALLRGGAHFADGWNFGPAMDSVRDVEWIAMKLCECWGGAARMSVAEDASYHGARNLMLDSSKARVELGWRPIWSVEQAITRIVDWHQHHFAGVDALSLCMRDIDAYRQEQELLRGHLA